MKIEMNVFGKNGRIMKNALVSFLTLLAVSAVACAKEDTKKRNRLSKM